MYASWLNLIEATFIFQPKGWITKRRSNSIMLHAPLGCCLWGVQSTCQFITVNVKPAAIVIKSKKTI